MNNIIITCLHNIKYKKYFTEVGWKTKKRTNITTSGLHNPEPNKTNLSNYVIRNSTLNYTRFRNLELLENQKCYRIM